MKKRRLFILAAIILLAIYLRLFKLGEVPFSLYWDEISIGYNAYSIGQTGRDEYGKLFPPTFETFQEYKLPGYIYSTVLSQFIWGLNGLGVRFPAAVFGIASTFFIYLIVQELFNSSKNKSKLSLLSSFFFAISPWSLQFTRAGFETSGGLLFSLIGIWLLIRWLRTKDRLLLSVISFGISLYFYYQPWVFIPLFLFFVLILHKKQLMGKVKQIIFAIIIFILIFLPLFLNLFTKSSNRLSFVQSVFKQEAYTEEIKERIEEGNTAVSRLVHNPYLIKPVLFLNNYLKYFSPSFLFIDGDPNARHGVYGMGNCYLWLCAFFYLGIIYLVKDSPKQARIIIFWLILAPLPASLSMPSPHSLRSLLMSPVIDIISAFGVIGLLNLLKDKRLVAIYKTSLLVVFSVFMLRYLHLYYQHEKDRSLDWADGHKQLYEYLNKENAENKYDRIYITGKYWRPYIFALFYQKYPPKLYQQAISNDRIGKYYFGYADFDNTNPRYNYQSFSLDKLKTTSNTLLVIAPGEIFIPSPKLIKTQIYTTSGKVVFQILDSNTLITANED